MKWDVFISHASEDKEFARALAEALESIGLNVWFDEFNLQVGDSLRRSIDQGLVSSRYGVVILSNHFFRKEWPKKELDALMAREGGTEKVLLPIWHNLTISEVIKHSPLLADKLSLSSDQSLDYICEQILKAIYSRQADISKQSPDLIHWPDGSEMILLDVRPKKINE